MVLFWPSVIFPFQHVEDLLPALLKVYSNLPHLKWIDDGALNRQDKIPVQEQFALCFNTILSELAAKYANVRDRIVSAQIELLSITADIIIEILYLMRVLCFIIGLFRAFGRYSNDKEHPLISAIYPPPFTIGKADGMNSQPGELDRTKGLRLTTDSENWFWSDESSPEKQEQSARFRKMLSKHGSSFILPFPRDGTPPKFKFTVAELSSFSDIALISFSFNSFDMRYSPFKVAFKVERLLRKPILDIMDVYAADIYMVSALFVHDSFWL
ncbi:unnamed protein product [Gongylonema pulchrum]|uniref:Ras-GEF domain-containing protein n=1 Tax=Gongylonema pulchrum TaxID=637853 RepID=A0A183ECU7_9BILA|nr:unnamed protein product [Gongylonema pulchrum]